MEPLHKTMIIFGAILAFVSVGRAYMAIRYEPFASDEKRIVAQSLLFGMIALCLILWVIIP